MLIIILGFIVSYLIGAIPFGFIIGLVKGVDIRKAGSGNIGATNLSRVLGSFRYFVYAFILDFAKGSAAPLLFLFVVKNLVVADTETLKFLVEKPAYCMVFYSLAAILGHMFPVYLKFKGGKGVATGAGVVVVLAPIEFAICMGVFLVSFFLSRWVSLSSILAALTLVIAQILIKFDQAFDYQLAITLFCIVVMLLVIVRHRTNIIRIFTGTEPKVNFRKKKTEESPED